MLAALKRLGLFATARLGWNAKEWERGVIKKLSS